MNTYIQKKMNQLNIGLDIDGVLADFTRGWNKVYPDAPAIPDRYNYDPLMGKRFKAMAAAGTLNDFFLSLEPLFDPKELPFEPKAYVTARPVNTEITEQWLAKVGFPKKPIITVPWGENKIDAMNVLGIDTFIDDFYGNFVELNEGGVTTYLYTAPWNLHHDVGELRLNSLSDMLLLQL